MIKMNLQFPGGKKNSLSTNPFSCLCASYLFHGSYFMELQYSKSVCSIWLSRQVNKFLLLLLSILKVKRMDVIDYFFLHSWSYESHFPNSWLLQCIFNIHLKWTILLQIILTKSNSNTHLLLISLSFSLSN